MRRILFALLLSLLPAGLHGQGTLHEVTGDGVRLRAGPSTQSQILATLDRGTQVMVLERSGDWARVRHRDRTGYISAQFLRPVTVTPPPSPVREEPPPDRQQEPEPVPEAVRAAPLLSLGMFAGGSLGGSGYGTGVLVGASISRGFGGGAVRVMVDGSFSRYPRTDPGSGLVGVKLTMLAAAASLVFGLSPTAMIEPFVLAGGGVHRATTRAPRIDNQGSSSETTLNAAPHAGAGLRVGRATLEARYIRLEDFAPVNLRLGVRF